MVKAFKYFESLCKFLSDVKCPNRRSVEQRKSFSVNRFCFTCFRYGEYVTRMEAEDDRLMSGVDRMDELRGRWKRREINDVEFERLYWLLEREMNGVVK